MPLVDGGVVLQSRIGTRPSGICYLTPNVAGFHSLAYRAVLAVGEAPVPVVDNGPDEVVGDPHGVVRVLTGDRCVGVSVEVGRHPAVLDENLGLVFLGLLPVDELLDVGVVDIEDDHLGCTSGRTA